MWQDYFEKQRKQPAKYQHLGIAPLTITIKRSSLPLKLVQLNSLKQHQIVLMVFKIQGYTGTQQNCQYIGYPKYQNVTNPVQFFVIFSEQKEYLQISR